MYFHGKTAVITGAASGIGAETAKAFAQGGADIILLDINHKGLMEQKERLKEYPVQIKIFSVDLTDYDAVQKVGFEIYKTYNKIDILINVAGGGPDGEKPIAELSKESWDKLISINMGITFNCTKMVINKMIEQRSGKIINISSVAGVRGGPLDGRGGYAAAKAGIIGLSQTLARELAPYNIYVNVIAPGLHMTPLTSSKSSESLQENLNKIPMHKTGEPDKLAKLILFLASDDNQYITGDLICVDGGLCMH